MALQRRACQVWDPRAILACLLWHGASLENIWPPPWKKWSTSGKLMVIIYFFRLLWGLYSVFYFTIQFVNDELHFSCFQKLFQYKMSNVAQLVSLVCEVHRI